MKLITLVKIHCIALRVLQTLKRFWVYLFSQLFLRRRINANHNVTCSPSSAEKEIAMVSGLFVKRGRHALYGGFLLTE